MDKSRFGIFFLVFFSLGLTKTYANHEVEHTEAEWYDSSRDYVIGHTDNLAEWIDNFFGDASTEEEAPYSTLRLRIEQDWDERDKFDTDVRLRGKVYLPKLNRRLSLLFSDDDGETGQDDLLTDERNSPDDVALQYTARERKYYRLDFKVGIRSSGDPKTSVRYKYERPFLDHYIGRFSQDVRYRGGEGFGSRTRFDLDRIIDETHLLRWFNKADWEEEESGVSWDTGVSYTKRLSHKRAVSYYISAGGETQPYGITNSYGLGVRYRQNVLRPWLFAEVQPSYRWQKDNDIRDREGRAAIFLRLEAVFEKDFGE